MACFDAHEKIKRGQHVPSGESEGRNYHTQIDQLAGVVEQDVIAWRHDIHQNPELSNRESRPQR